MNKHLIYYRPGEEARMQARCQFGLAEDGSCGATITYPIKGYPWRRNIVKHYKFELKEKMIDQLFAEFERMKIEFPSECLSNDDLWNDHSEKANPIPRDKKYNTLCCFIGIHQETCDWEDHFSIREDSPALINSELYRVISQLIAPYESLI